MKKHVVIFGGTSGIGLATAQRLSNAGYRVTITGRNSQKFERIASLFNDDVHAKVLDASDEGAVKEFFKTIGQFDHLVLAFGSTNGGGALADVQMESVRKGFEEKVFPHISCAKYAAPYIAKNGSITFISAVTAFAAMPGTTGLASANAAVAALVPVLAAELKPVRVNGVAPGVIDTPWWDFLPADQKQGAFASYASQTPVGRVGTADDVAHAISFLVDNTFVTGHTIVCDGGIRLSA